MFVFFDDFVVVWLESSLIQIFDTFDQRNVMDFDPTRQDTCGKMDHEKFLIRGYDGGQFGSSLQLVNGELSGCHYGEKKRGAKRPHQGYQKGMDNCSRKRFNVKETSWYGGCHMVESEGGPQNWIF